MKKVIGICGLIGHGKDTAAGFLIAEGYQRISFAGVLKDACANIFGWDRILLEGNTPESRAFREMPDQWWSNRLGINNFTPRYALQHVGTDVLRTHFHPDIWVAACERQIDMAEKNVVISDCRFFNELNAIRNLGGTTAVVWRNETPNWWEHAVNANTIDQQDLMNKYPDVHTSEWSWAGWNFDKTLQNTSTLDQLKEQTLELLS